MADRARAVELPVFGVPVRFEADDPALLALVEASFGSWRGGEVSHRGEGLLVRLHVAAGEELGVARPEVRVRILPDGRMILSTAGSVGMADPERGRAFGYLTRALISDATYARSSFAEALTLRMMGMRDRLPFHAAAVAQGDAALLLTGPSGAGKSSLAYACSRAGMRVLAEDVVWVQRSPQLRVWGRSDFVHLAPDAVEFFPELAGHPLIVRANHKQKIAANLGTFDATGVPWVERVGVCVVSRTGGAAKIDDLDPREATRALYDDLEAGFDLFKEDAHEMIESITARGCWRLDPGPHPAAALPFIEGALARVGSSVFP